MGRGDDDKRARRAREQIDKAIARRDLELAIDAVLGLDKAAREPFLDLVSPFFRRTLPELHRASAWARLHTLAARAEQEPRLLARGSDEAGLAAARWPLFLACMRARDFARAGRIWKLLVECVTARAPALAPAITAWLDGQGRVDAKALVGLSLDVLPPPVAPDPRLGIESTTRPRLAPPAAPVSVEQAEGALFALFAAQPLPAVADTLMTWLDRATPELAEALRTRAGGLAMRELLIQARSAASLALPARLLARISEGEENALAPEILLATRLLLPAVMSKTATKEERESLQALAGALARTAQLKECAEAMARDFARTPGLASLALAICEGALSAAASLPDARLFSIWEQTLHLNAPPPQAHMEDQLCFPGPTWLQAASREVCKRGQALAAHLDKLDLSVRGRLLDSLAWGQPSEIVADVIDAVWKTASDNVRRDLARILPDLIDLSEKTSLTALVGSRTFADLATLDRIVSDADKADPDLPFMAAGGLSLWRRFGLRALPYCAELLPFALSQASQPRQRIEAVTAYVGNRTDIEAWLEVLRELSMGESEMLPSLIGETCRLMIDRFRNDRIALARAVNQTMGLSAPFAVVKVVAHAYQRAALAEDGAELTPEDERARELLGFMLGHENKKSPRKIRPARARKTSRKKQGGQIALPLDEDDS